STPGLSLARQGRPPIRPVPGGAIQRESASGRGDPAQMGWTAQHLVKPASQSAIVAAREKTRRPPPGCPRRRVRRVAGAPGSRSVRRLVAYRMQFVRDSRSPHPPAETTPPPLLLEFENGLPGPWPASCEPGRPRPRLRPDTARARRVAGLADA